MGDRGGPVVEGQADEVARRLRHEAGLEVLPLLGVERSEVAVREPADVIDTGHQTEGNADHVHVRRGCNRLSTIRRTWRRTLGT